MKTGIIILAIAGVAIGAYFLFKKPAATTSTTTTDTTKNGLTSVISGINVGDLTKLL